MIFKNKMKKKFSDKIVLKNKLSETLMTRSSFFFVFYSDLISMKFLKHFNQSCINPMCFTLKKQT